MPDAGLHHIPSLLETHEAVRMCTLLKRWRNVWTYLPDLTFDVQTFLSSSPPVPEQRTLFPITGRKSNLDRFVLFVSRVLLKHQPIDLRILHHNCSGGGGGSDFKEDYIKSWIVYAVKHNTLIFLTSETCNSNKFIWTTTSQSCSSAASLSLKRSESSVDDGPHVMKVNAPNLTSFPFDGIPIQQTIFENTPSLIHGHMDFQDYCDFDMEHYESLLLFLLLKTLF
ncbi:F-box/RNI-like superfamily protein [Rhynchospora pubera]|uniref:F-box/RNI-like superfamily protein n=1 Tax=Rhynchospora pubera TaxID=906938 RepID=A0AAV8CCC9_9POAL|nr:F-box/RNI-like superfamily protein [Rhynchospora pubera]